MTRWIAVALLWLGLALPAAAQSPDPYYKLDVLNAGLGPAPDWLDRSTPQSSVEALFDLSDTGNIDVAAHLLDLGAIDPMRQPEMGPRLAGYLVDVLNRKAVIDWNALLDRPDALDARATSESAVAGQSQLSLLIDTIELDGRPIELRLNRVKPEGGDPVWVFSRQAAMRLPALHARYGPSDLELSLPTALRQPAFWGLMWWEVAGLPLLILAALAVAFITSRLARMLARRVHSRTATAVLRAVRLPLIIFAVTLTVGTVTGAFFIFSGRIDTVLSPLIALGYTTAALMFVLNGVDAVLDRIVSPDESTLHEAGKEARRDTATKVAAFRRILIVLIVLIGGGIVLSEAQLFGSLGVSLLASAGAVTLILGFAARTILGNILSSLQIAMNRSAKIGDKIQFRDHICTVERINFTYVQLLDWTGVRLVVPVSDFVSEPFEIWTMRNPSMYRVVKLKLAHDADVDALRRAFFEVIDDQEPDQVCDRDDHMVMVNDHDVFGQEVWFCLACADANTAWMLSCQVREALLVKARELARTGVPVFPQANPAEAA